MAEQKLIQGAFSGRVGQLVGQQTGGRNIVKSRCQGLSKKNPEKIKAVRAFEALNRLSSSIAKQFFYELGISVKNMHKHNAVSSYLKPLIAGKTFDPLKINEVISQTNLIVINNFDINPEYGTIAVQWTLDPELESQPNYRQLLIVCDSEGYIYHSRVEEPDNRAINIRQQIKRGLTYYAFFIVSYIDEGEKKVFTSNIKYQLAQLIVEFGILYTSRMKNTTALYKTPATARIAGGFKYEAETLIYPPA